MSAWMKRAVLVAGLTGGLMFLAGAAWGDDGIADGNTAAVQAGNGPGAQATVCGNTVSIGGDGSADCAGGQESDAAESSSIDGGTGDQDDPALSGNTAGAQVGNDSEGQVTACGNAIGAFGDAAASCSGEQSGSSGGDQFVDGDGDDGNASGDDTASGNTAGVQAGDGPTAQATVCGNAVSLRGDASGSCQGEQQAGTSSESTVQGAEGEEGANGDEGAPEDGTLSDDTVGVQALNDPSVDGAVCGNSVGLGGDTSAECGGTQTAGSDGSLRIGTGNGIVTAQGGPGGGGQTSPPGTGPPGDGQESGTEFPGGGPKPGGGSLLGGPAGGGARVAGGALALTGSPDLRALLAVALALILLGASLVAAEGRRTVRAGAEGR